MLLFFFLLALLLFFVLSCFLFLVLFSCFVSSFFFFCFCFFSVCSGFCFLPLSLPIEFAECRQSTPSREGEVPDLHHGLVTTAPALSASFARGRVGHCLRRARTKTTTPTTTTTEFPLYNLPDQIVVLFFFLFFFCVHLRLGESLCECWPIQRFHLGTGLPKWTTTTTATAV